MEERPRKLQKVDNDTTTLTENEIASALQPESPTSGEDIAKDNSHQPEEAIKNGGNDNPNDGTLGRPDGGAAGPAPSKNKLKKLRKREQWEAGRDWRKAKRK